jgi:hypothetical protein
MQADRHESICHIVDKSLAGAASAEEEQTLGQHLRTCTPCSEYLEASQRAIAGLGGFSFDVNPELQERVLASVERQSLEEKRRQPITLWGNRLVALLLTVAGSFTASRLASPAAEVFHLQPAKIHFGLLAFWIVPSVCFCLLYLLLTGSSGWTNKEGLSQ